MDGLEQYRLHHRYKVGDIVKVRHEDDPEGLGPDFFIGCICKMDEYSFEDVSSGFDKHIYAIGMHRAGSFGLDFNDEDIICKMEDTGLTKDIITGSNSRTLFGYKDNEGKIYYLYDD